MVPLRRVARLLNGGTPTPDPENWGDEVSWATPVDLAAADGGVLRHTERRLTAVGLRQGSSMAPPGSVLLSTRAPIGYTSRLADGSAFNQGCKAVVPDAQASDVRFVQYWLSANRSPLNELGSGSTFRELGNEALLAFPVPKRPKREQQRVADFLDDRVFRIDSIIAGRRAQADGADECLRGWLADIVLAGETGVPLKRLVENETLGVWGTEPSGDDTDTAVARVADFDRSSFRLGEVPTLRRIESQQLAPRLLRPGDVLLERSGGTQKNPVGCVAFVDELARPTVCSNFVSRVRPGADVDGRYLSLVMSALYATGQQRPHSTQATGIQNLNPASYFDIRVPSLAYAQQLAVRRIADDEISEIRSLQAALSRSIELLTEYKQSLITAAVTGELDVTTARTRLPV